MERCGATDGRGGLEERGSGGGGGKGGGGGGGGGSCGMRGS